MSAVAIFIVRMTSASLAHSSFCFSMKLSRASYALAWAETRVPVHAPRWRHVSEKSESPPFSLCLVHFSKIWLLQLSHNDRPFVDFQTFKFNIHSESNIVLLNIPSVTFQRHFSFSFFFFFLFFLSTVAALTVWQLCTRRNTRQSVDTWSRLVDNRELPFPAAALE